MDIPGTLILLNRIERAPGFEAFFLVLRFLKKVEFCFESFGDFDSPVLPYDALLRGAGFVGYQQCVWDRKLGSALGCLDTPKAIPAARP